MSFALVTCCHLLPSPLEPHVLENLGRVAIEPGGRPVVTALCREVAAGDPGGCAEARVAELLEAALGGDELLLGLVEPLLFEQRAAEHEMAPADLVEEVLAPVQQLERVADLLLRELWVSRPEMNLGERRNGLRSVGLVAGVEGDLEGFLQLVDGLLGLAEQEVEHSEVVGEPADVDLVGELLVRALRLLGVAAGEHPVALAVGDDRSLEVRLADRARILDGLGELERALDVLARGLVVAVVAPAAGAPGEDLRPECVAGEPGALGERERLVEEGERRLDAREAEAADSEPEQHVGALDVGEIGALDDRASLIEELERLPGLAEAHERPGGPVEDTDLELGEAARAHGRDERFVVLPRLLDLACLDQRLGACNRSLEAAALVGRDAVREEAGVDAEPDREPVDRLARGPGLAPLDLADVLLREPVAGQITLRQARGDAQLPQALAQAEAPGGCLRAGVGSEFAAHAAATDP